MATASLVGNSLGAGDAARAWSVVRAARGIGLGLGLLAALGFWTAARFLIPRFTEDPAVARETLRYVSVLAFSQPFVAMEAVHEKVLLGAGRTKAILLGAGAGNLARVPLAWYFAIHGGLGASAVYWTINATSLVKASLFAALVQRGRWTEPR
jgi:Na+-driven multidrug efflux pump